jgi:hypothetical protein
MTLGGGFPKAKVAHRQRWWSTLWGASRSFVLIAESVFQITHFVSNIYVRLPPHEATRETTNRYPRSSDRREQPRVPPNRWRRHASAPSYAAAGEPLSSAAIADRIPSSARFPSSQLPSSRRPRCGTVGHVRLLAGVQILWMCSPDNANPCSVMCIFFTE